MKKFIKIIALTLPVAMLAVGLVACSGGAAQDEEGEWGDFSWSYKKDTKTLTVTGAGDMPSAESSADVPWAALRPYIEAIRLRSEGAPVTSVGDYAIYGLIKLEEVELDETLAVLEGETAIHVVSSRQRSSQVAAQTEVCYFTKTSEVLQTLVGCGVVNQ